MHWTGLLAYRRFPPQARVIDDLACINCGHNLRGTQVGGRCPECGGAVGDSLFVLAQPEIVGRCLRGVAGSLLCFLALGIGCINWWAAPWMLIVTTAILAGGSAWRVMSLAELRARGKIDKLPVIGFRLLALWLCALLNLAASIAWLGASIAWAKLPAWQGSAGQQMIAVAGTVSVASMFLIAGAAGWLGAALATMLGYGWMRIEFQVQLVSVVLGALAMALMLIMIKTASSTWAVFAGMGMAALTVMAAFGLTVVSLLHLANAAEREDEAWDEAIDLSAPRL